MYFNVRHLCLWFFGALLTYSVHFLRLLRVFKHFREKNYLIKALDETLEGPLSWAKKENYSVLLQTMVMVM
jgi:hypothetical protein